MWAVLIIIGLMGCSSDPSPKYVGLWIGHVKVERQPGDTDAVLNTLGLIQLTIHRTGKFDLLESGVPRSGDYEQYPDFGKLVTKDIMGKSLATQPADVRAQNGDIKVILQPSGTLLFEVSGSSNAAGIELHRRKAGEPYIH